MQVNYDECEAANVDPEKIKRIAQRLSKCGKELNAMGLEVFGGSGIGTIRQSANGDGSLILAYLDGIFDGGDGAAIEGNDGLLRGEY